MSFLWGRQGGGERGGGGGYVDYLETPLATQVITSSKELSDSSIQANRAKCTISAFF